MPYISGGRVFSSWRCWIWKICNRCFSNSSVFILEVSWNDNHIVEQISRQYFCRRDTWFISDIHILGYSHLLGVAYDLVFQQASDLCRILGFNEIQSIGVKGNDQWMYEMDWTVSDSIGIWFNRWFDLRQVHSWIVWYTVQWNWIMCVDEWFEHRNSWYEWFVFGLVWCVMVNVCQLLLTSTSTSSWVLMQPFNLWFDLRSV